MWCMSSDVFPYSWGLRTLDVYSMSHRCELTSFVLHTLFIYLGWHTLYQPVDKQGKERGKGLPRFLAVFDTVSVAAVVCRTRRLTRPLPPDGPLVCLVAKMPEI